MVIISKPNSALRLKVVIVGAGIGGMAAAVGCGLAGHDVLVLEDAPAIAEVGAGLQVAPNMMRILTRWGLRDIVIASSVSLTSVHIRRWSSGALLGEAPVNKSFGDQYVIHRADLHRALYERAVRLPNVRVRVNATVVSADFGEEEGGKGAGVLLKGGERVKADVVLAADGIKSRLRQQMLGLDVDTPTPTGDAAYRVILPRAAMLSDPDLRELIDTPRGTRWIGPGRHIMAYPIKAHQQYNMVLLHPDTSEGSEESWTAVGTKQELVDTYKGWDPVLQKIFALIPDEKVMRWKLCTHGFLETWTKSRVALLGDACHPMLFVVPIRPITLLPQLTCTRPYVAQGAAQAVEDAATLAVLLSSIPDRSSIPQALRLYQIARKTRAETIQGTAMSNREALHMPDGPAQIERDTKFANIFGGGENPDKWGDPTQQEFLWGWDAEDAARKVLGKGDGVRSML
ncbi:putative salicylate hydroxylase [Tricharina praecox]|uniref:putative salicylate hydroxylase n=1 Tax=Tricharina praecox TaxID=43433 RepID=UPI00221F8039|nr:putative salicylate hydroxylase [Tricharina praecox]KAI5859206.1 putative salicylate hydroxylase [Tricharina praecox]